MTAQTGRVSDERYSNWIKDTLALIYLKEGLEVFVDYQSARFHGQLLAALGKQSCNCSWQDLSKGKTSWKVNCPTGICKKWLDLIIQHHKYRPLPTLVPQNTDPKLWTADAWEIIKLYQAKGYQGQHSAKETDVAGILAVIGNCDHFHGFISNVKLVNEIQSIRNKTMHSSDFLVETVDLTRDLQTMLQFLHDLNYLAAAEQHLVKTAIDKIDELLVAKLDLCLNRELELKALQAKLFFLETKINNLEGLEDQLEIEVQARKQQQDKVEHEVQTIGQRQDSLLNTINDIRKNMATQQSTNSIITSLSSLQQKCNTLAEDLSKINQTIQEHEDHINEQGGHIKEQGTHIKEHGDQINELGDHIRENREHLEEHDEHLKKQETHIKEQETHIKEQGGHIKEQGGHIKEHGYHIKEHGEHIKEHEEHIRSQGDHIKEQGDHITVLYERQKNIDIERQVQGNQLEDHKGRLETLESHHNQTGDEKREITDTDIAALQAFLRNYYKTMRLKIPNPVVSEELRLDSLYVDPDIKVLRETTDPGRGLVNVQDQPTQANVSQCRQLFYTDAYTCRQIYITGDAGLGKSMFCNHLVDLWCKTGNDTLTNIACSSETSSYAIVSEDSDSEEDIFGDIESEDKMFENVIELLALTRYLNDFDNIDRDGKFLSLSKFFENENKKRIERKYYAKKKTLIERRENAKRRNEQDMRIMAEFKLLFYIALRESPDQYHIADMIDSQILQHNYERQYPAASVLLKKVPCLVIIDGLDEWVCPKDANVPSFVKPGIPGRDWLNQRNVFLTTTRSWKFDVLQLTSSEVDKHVELVGFNNYSSGTLCHKITKLLKRAERSQRTKGKFQTELEEKGLSHLRNIPVILTQLICLWFDKQDLGKSQVQLYCSMLEMLLKRSDKNLPKQTVASTPDTACKENLLPECFSNQMHCQTHQHLLLSLGKVAFEALFSQNREHALVFKSSQMKILGVDQNNVELCLKSGILSQSKVLGKWSVSEKKLSFLHKKLQEFLAAIFICENAECVKSHVLQYCTTVESMLEMSQVWMFVSGIRPDLAKQLLTDLMNSVVLKDARLQQYRHTIAGFKNIDLARSIQKCIENCVIEASSNGYLDFCLPLEDFVLEKDTVVASLESLFTFNKATLRSVHIQTCGMTPSTAEAVTRMVQLKDAHRLQRLFLNVSLFGVPYMDPVCQQLDSYNNLTSLALYYIKLTTASLAALCGALNHVTTLDLTFVSLTHEQREQLLSSVSQAHDMRDLRLSSLNCTDHGDQCRAGIELSGLSQVKHIELHDFCVERLSAVTHCVKVVKLASCSIERRQMQEFVDQLSFKSHFLWVILLKLTITGDSENKKHSLPD